MTTTKKIKAEPGQKPPANTKRVYRWGDLPNTKERASYIVEDSDGKTRKITVANHKRQVLEGLMVQPILAASYCRISDQVMPLRRDYGLNIICTLYQNDPETGREIYGVYTLHSQVRRALPEGV